MSGRNNPFPLPPNTTFGLAPQVTDDKSLKAYFVWIITRGVYECCRLWLWYKVTFTVAQVVENLKGIIALKPV